jgi:diguanylate cyclase (GGDEF)-like protein
MVKKGTKKIRLQYMKAILYLILVITIAMVIEILILHSLNSRNSNGTSLVLLDQVVGVIEENDQNEEELVETLKEDYIIRAQTVAYILDAKSDAEYDVSELKKIADMMSIDEIHLFNTDGVIYSGSEPKYYGYNFNSGEQMAYFKPMLEDRNLTMCQDVTPNTAEGKNMMYAITWNESGDKMIQVGIEPLRLLEELRSNEISEVISNMPAYEGISIWVADADSGKICGSTDSDMIGRTLDEIGIDNADVGTNTMSRDVVRIDGYNNYCNLRNMGDYIVVVATSAKANIRNYITSMCIELVYLILAGLMIMHMLRRVLKANDEKDAQMKILVSMSEIYESMHLIDLENNTVVEYNDFDEVRKTVNDINGADSMLRQVISLTTEQEYCEAALAFTDIHTLADRMRGRKIISEEFVSKATGWYRASFITIKENDEGQPTEVVYVTQNIDNQKKKEEELLLKSNVDELTGLYNRRAYEEDIDEHNDSVTAENFVFVSLDVNGLKLVNDTKGHVAGDELLVGVANCMKQCFQPYGKVYRLGGDEFVAMIFADEAQLEKIKKEFEQATAQWSGSLIDRLSVSCGYVKKSEVETTSVHEMADIADKDMYEAKSDFYRKE